MADLLLTQDSFVSLPTNLLRVDYIRIGIFKNRALSRDHEKICRSLIV
jgi:hypothetical protein